MAGYQIEGPEGHSRSQVRDRITSPAATSSATAESARPRPVRARSTSAAATNSVSLRPVHPTSPRSATPPLGCTGHRGDDRPMGPGFLSPDSASVDHVVCYNSATSVPASMFSDATRPTAGCLFSGMGGFATGLLEAGFDVRWACDNNEYACLTFRHRYPTINLYQTAVETLRADDGTLPPVDVLAAGFPCQSFSQAGDRKGFGDKRGEAFFEIPRLLREYPPGRRPLFVILENVGHLLYGADGWWFDQIQHEIRASGYWFRRESCWVANVKDVTDTPQDRERLFLVAASREHFTYNPFVSPQLRQPSRRPLAEIVDRTSRAPTGDYLPADNRYAKMIAKAIDEGQSATGIYQLRRSYVREKRGGLCPTLTANMGTGGHNVPFVRDRWGIRRLSVQEVAELQGFGEEDDLFPQDVPIPERYRLLGNAVCPKLAQLVGAACRRALLSGGSE